MKSKQKRRSRRKKAEEERRRRRDERLEKPLGTAKGLGLIDVLDEFFVGYRLKPEPDRVGEMLTHIEQLNLLKLQTHRDAIGAMVATIYRMHEDHQAKWLVDHRDTIQSALHLFKDPEDGVIEIRDIVDIDKNLVAWMVSGQTHFLDAVLDVSYQDDQLGEQARRAIGYYRERCEDLDRLYLDDRQERIRQQEDGEQRVEDQQKQAEKIRQLAESLRDSPDWGKVVFVAYVDGSYVISTIDGEAIEDAPMVWDDRPVIHREATDDECRIHQQWQDRMEEPL